ncbi:phytoene desaturase family protein [Turneriella parva]|uniref:Fumarate reductase/succinate dehydrogenase flavoprotein domain protein n=1 Tax=Turneriella parva (strain ATCC BAA-1111 / DSM 21527 / NCTC 11395 / H) TaxID=869212 RepID=I4BAN9_TURPD|nr:NAD(P)/FAD-dependent oxidoreductase [Turneriella parva]AFM14346.1 fumarate reductase/succinate dehydrogenase flavoprotein domain protein [Turneriella parva DSM 21527]
MTADAVVIGSGPNGLAAAIRLAEAGVSVHVIEAADEIGGGTRTAELTLKGYQHDVCSSVHPMGVVSPFFKSLPLERHGLKFIYPEASVAHPLDNGGVALLLPGVRDTAERLGIDARKYKNLVEPFVAAADALFADALHPTGFPRHPLLMARFGLKAIRSAEALWKCFKTDEARALIAGCAAHSILPLDKPITAAVALIFLIAGHVKPWPIAAGGSQAITNALASYLRSLGGTIETGRRITGPKDLPEARAYLFDTSPNLLASGFLGVLPQGYVNRLNKFRYGPGVFKVDYALSQSIPWTNRECLKASTVHLGGRCEEIAASEAEIWQGRDPQKPFVLLTQQSEFDGSRAPKGKHTLWAYCHVPNGSRADLAETIENQIERFAPGFKKTILKRHAMHTADFEAYNANYVGGAITGGVADLWQFVTRPVARLNPYTTPNPKIFLCSASTPPGGGVHGMCGFHAANAALSRLAKLPRSPLAIL